MGLWFGFMVFAAIVIVFIIILPAGILHAIGTFLGQAASGLLHLLGGKLQAASTYNATNK
jgi:hypothetical protein